MLDADVTGRSSSSPLLSLHGRCPVQLSSHTDDDEAYIDEKLVDRDVRMCTTWSRDVSVRLIALKCIEEMIDDVMRHTGGKKL